MKRLEGQKRTFYMDEHGPYRHVDVDFYPAELVEKIITDLSNQVLDERKEWTSMFDHFKAKRKELRDARHAAVHEKDKYEKALRLLVEHDLIKDCPYMVVVKNLVKGKEL
ncbi:MAG: hypothetical protein K5651_07155 [Bacteroidales bacterium]|nr:hypothetical protein [Bacteroidales bacterium]